MSTLLPITLTAIRGNWNRFQARLKNPHFQEVQKKILARDNYTCRYCGFESDKFNFVVNHDHDYKNNVAKNMVTSCPFCTQCFFLDGIGKDENMGGLVIYLPEVSQADLNHFCRVLFCSMLRDAPYKGKLQSTYLNLKDRLQYTEELFGPDTGSPATFGQALLDSGIKKDQLQSKVMENIKLLPLRKYFAPQINYWKRSIYSQIPI